MARPDYQLGQKVYLRAGGDEGIISARIDRGVWHYEVAWGRSEDGSIHGAEVPGHLLSAKPITPRKLDAFAPTSIEAAEEAPPIVGDVDDLEEYDPTEI